MALTDHCDVFVSVFEAGVAERRLGRSAAKSRAPRGQLRRVLQRRRGADKRST
jgi:hypothetical protein